MDDARLMTKKQRLARVKYFMVRHLSYQQIADTVGISLKTVKNYAAEIRAQQAHEISSQSVFALAGSYYEEWKLVQIERWTLISGIDQARKEGSIPLSEAVRLKARLLAEIERAGGNRVDRLTKLGVIIPSTPEITRDMAAVTVLNSFPPGVLEQALTQNVECFLRTMKAHAGEDVMNLLLGQAQPRDEIVTDDGETDAGDPDV